MVGKCPTNLLKNTRFLAANCLNLSKKSLGFRLTNVEMQVCRNVEMIRCLSVICKNVKCQHLTQATGLHQEKKKNIN